MLYMTPSGCYEMTPTPIYFRRAVPPEEWSTIKIWMERPTNRVTGKVTVDLLCHHANLRIRKSLDSRRLGASLAAGVELDSLCNHSGLFGVNWCSVHRYAT